MTSMFFPQARSPQFRTRPPCLLEAHCSVGLAGLWKVALPLPLRTRVHGDEWNGLVERGSREAVVRMCRTLPSKRNPNRSWVGMCAIQEITFRYNANRWYMHRPTVRA